MQVRYDPTTHEAETFTIDVSLNKGKTNKWSSVFKRYIWRNLSWKRARQRNSMFVTRRLPMTNSQAMHNQPSSYPHDQRRIRCTTKEKRQPRNDFRCSSSQVMKQYGAYTESPAQKTMSTIIEVTIDKRLLFQVIWLNIPRDTSIKAWPKIHLKIEVLHSFCNPDPTMII